MQTRFKLLKIIADGNFYSGDELGRALGVGRGAIWRYIQALRGDGLDIYAVTGRGYRLGEALELLSSAEIRAKLPDAVNSLLPEIEIHYLLDSTNNHLMRSEAHRLPSGSVCIAEHQQMGRGRQGRRWHSQFARDLCFSLVWQFNCGPDALSGLSLAVAVGVANGLSALGLTNPGLKWPNDLYVEDNKLAGILLEMSGESSGTSRVVVGVGLNLRMSPEVGASIDQPWTSLEALLARPVSRNRAAAEIIGGVADALAKFSANGLSPFLPLWKRWDITANKRVTLQQAQGVIEGKACGIDASGALLIEHRGEVSRYLSGDVSLLRAVSL